MLAPLQWIAAFQPLGAVRGEAWNYDPLHTAILQPGRGNPLQFLSTKTDIFPKKNMGIFHCQVWEPVTWTALLFTGNPLITELGSLLGDPSPVSKSSGEIEWTPGWCWPMICRVIWWAKISKPDSHQQPIKCASCRNVINVPIKSRGIQIWLISIFRRFFSDSQSTRLMQRFAKKCDDLRLVVASGGLQTDGFHQIAIVTMIQFGCHIYCHHNCHW